MAFDISFAGIDLEGAAVWPEEKSNRVQIDRFPRRQGAIVTQVPLKAERIVRITGEVFKTAAANLDSYMDDLSKVLADGQGQLVFRDDGRYFNAVVRDYRTTHDANRSPDLRFGYDIEFVIGDPYAYATSESNSGAQSISSSPTTFSVNNTGKAKTPARIEVTATGANRTGTFKLDFTTNGMTAQYGSATVNQNQVLIIDSVAMRVDNGGQNGMNLYSGDLPILLEPGSNNITYTGPVTVSVVIAWRNRWD